MEILTLLSICQCNLHRLVAITQVTFVVLKICDVFGNLSMSFVPTKA